MKASGFPCECGWEGEVAVLSIDTEADGCPRRMTLHCLRCEATWVEHYDPKLGWRRL